MKFQSAKDNFGILLFGAVFILGVIAVSNLANAVNLNSQVIVGNAAPSVTNVRLNNNGAITLTSNTTTSVNINFTVSDANGCGEVFFSGNVTSTAFRNALGHSCSANNLNCYITSAVLSHSCPSATSAQTTADATTTVYIYYFAQATDASSSFASDFWTGGVATRDVSGATSSATSSVAVEINTLTAINVTTSSINYGSVAAGSDTGSTNQNTSSTNAGNSSSTLRLYAVSTLTSGANSIATTSQRYATTTFTFPGVGVQLTDTAATVSGFLLTSPTSTSYVSQAVQWGLQVPGGTPTGTYTGVNGFIPLFQP